MTIDHHYVNYTNLMQQYLKNKEQCMDTFMLFRIGDFYECFFDDAILLSKLLGLKLTKRSNHGGAPMCGIPHLQKDKYIDKIIQEGYKVTVCEQVEDPALVANKQLVKREIIQTITPGTIMSEENLDRESHNYIACISKPSTTFGLAVCDLTTGDFMVTELVDDVNGLMAELSAYSPSELVIDSSIKRQRGLVKSLKMELDLVVSSVEDQPDYADTLMLQFSELPDCPHTALHTAGILYAYLQNTQKGSLSYIKRLKYYAPNDYMVLDSNTRKHLELVESLSGTKTGSLLWAIDYTETTMGKRLLRELINRPCIDKEIIEKRLDCVDYLVSQPSARLEIKNLLSQVGDIERLAGKVSYETANAKDLLRIAETLEIAPTLRHLMEKSNLTLMQKLAEQIHDVTDLVDEIKRAIVNNPPTTVKEGGIIRDGYDEQLDEYRHISANGASWIAQYQERLRRETDIKNLKIVYNQSMGYYIEVPRSQAPFMSKDKFEKMQELTNKVRYRTAELMQKQQIMREAEMTMIDLEYRLFVKVREKVSKRVNDIKDIAKAIAYIDVLYSFAECSVRNNFVRPQIVGDHNVLEIRDGRHPVVEKGLLKIEYISNDTLFSEDEKILLITGPNMAGKSTYMRQVAIISLMAHLGSHVPASKCVVPIIDRIFTRIGASDNLYGGESTFMLEMKDIRNITNEATARSLVIIDELGRGTSVEDGTAIARAVLEYLHDKIRCKTIVSTHYYTLTTLTNRLPRMVNYHMAVDESDEDIVFLHKLSKGVASSSYGIYCAKLAGVRSEIVERAYELVGQIPHTQSSQYTQSTPTHLQAP